MPDPIELDPVDALGAGAVGEPGERVFYLQARKERAQLTVLVEKEQVALLATEAVAFLDRIADEYPETPMTLPVSVAELQEPTVPLFRARLIGLGFDPERELVLINVRTESSAALQLVLQLAARNHLRVTEVMEDGVIIEATGEWKEINTLVSKLTPFGIRHIVRTGPVALWKHPSAEVMSLLGTISAAGAPAAEGDATAIPFNDLSSNRKETQT